MEELLTAMSGGKYFSKLNLQDMYLQLPLDAASKQYVAINGLAKRVVQTVKHGLKATKGDSLQE